MGYLMVLIKNKYALVVKMENHYQDNDLLFDYVFSCLSALTASLIFTSSIILLILASFISGSLHFRMLNNNLVYYLECSESIKLCYLNMCDITLNVDIAKHTT